MSVAAGRSMKSETSGREGRAAAVRVELVFRVATSLIFLAAGLGHLVRTDQMIERLNEAPLGAHLSAFLPVELLMVASGVVLVIGGAALAAGLRARWAAWSLILVLVPITLTSHVGHGGDPGPLLKNVALLGSLLHFATVGAGRWSIDAHLQSR